MNINSELSHKIFVPLIMACILVKRVVFWVAVRNKAIFLTLVWACVGMTVLQSKGVIDDVDYLILLSISFLGLTSAWGGM